MSKKSLLLCVVLGLVPATVLAGEMMALEGVKSFNQAVQEQKAGKYAQASSDYQQALLIMGESKKTELFRKYVLQNLGVIAVKQGDMTGAEAMFRQALEIDPNYKDALYNLGVLYNHQGDAVKAMQVWTQMMDFPNEFKTVGEQKDTEDPFVTQ